MKVALITPVFFPYFAGIGQVAANEAKGLSQSGEEVTVITPRYNSGDSELEISPDGYKVRRLQPVFKFGNAALVKYGKKILEGFDLIHLHFPFIGGIKGILDLENKDSKLKIPLVVTYHMDLIGRGWKGYFFEIYTYVTLSRLVKKADKIIVSSWDYARKSRLTKFIQKDVGKFAEGPFGVEIKDCKPKMTKVDLKNKLGIKEKEKIILFVGGLDKAHYFKGVDVLLKAAEKLIFDNHLPISKLIIVGDGSLRPHYEAEARKLGLGDKVIFIGRASDDDLSSYYGLADVFVLPSIDRSEAYGLVLLEAQAAGVPVVASNLPGVSAQVERGGRLVEPGNEGELALALKEMLEDDIKRRELGEQARLWVKENRSLHLEVARLLEIYKLVIPSN